MKFVAIKNTEVYTSIQEVSVCNVKGKFLFQKWDLGLMDDRKI